jgi:hypothetical protein
MAEELSEYMKVVKLISGKFMPFMGFSLQVSAIPLTP